MEANMWNYTGWVDASEFDNQSIKQKFDDILKSSGFTILNFVDHIFQPQGYTALWLLSESHFAIHTFPEENKYYIELSSCIQDKYDNFMKNYEGNA
jgi:S-adenosylmethionine/arginine decarboxylase-like enzyme